MMIFLVRLQGKFEVDYKRDYKGETAIEFVILCKND